MLGTLPMAHVPAFGFLAGWHRWWFPVQQEISGSMDPLRLNAKDGFSETRIELNAEPPDRGARYFAFRSTFFVNSD